ncbi:MAG: hypothetical protein P4N60_12775 [Verrucomicrobiae bacterium]|nr:hypothetical protein [Verrucomicrobiae bacterium]
MSRDFPQELPGTNAPGNLAQSLYVDINPVWHEPIGIGRQSLGELGVLHLVRREYAEALDALLRSGYWTDAAYVAELVMTTAELKAYVDRNWPAIAGRDKEVLSPLTGYDKPMSCREEIRYLLARRMARGVADREAMAYFPTNYAGDYAEFLARLKNGRDTNQPDEARAEALFAAAVLIRTNGLELFGTELEPDWGVLGGEYEFDPTWQGRKTNLWRATINVADRDEIERASSRYTEPDRRFHYRWQAAALAWEAAQLMPDNSEDTARMLCTGGTWLKDRDPQGADKFYKALVRRCRKTNLGEEADKIRWFPAQPYDGSRPRLETIEITAALTNSLSRDGDEFYSPEFPVPGRKYSVHEDEDVYVIARAVQRLGYPTSADIILKANPGMKRGVLGSGQLIMIPAASAGAADTPK